jgi:hypothetical protein
LIRTKGSPSPRKKPPPSVHPGRRTPATVIGQAVDDQLQGVHADGLAQDVSLPGQALLRRLGRHRWPGEGESRNTSICWSDTVGGLFTALAGFGVPASADALQDLVGTGPIQVLVQQRTFHQDVSL